MGPKRTSRILNMDLKVTKLGPNDPPECVSLILDQVPPHGSNTRDLQGYSVPKKSHLRKMWYALTLAVLSCFSEGGIFTVEWGGIITEIILTVNMPPIKNSPHKTGKSMLFFTFEIPLFIVMSINSQIYMTKPKQARKTLSENTGKTFSVIMPPFSSKGGA